MANHAYLSASGSFKWALCSGSRAFEDQFEEKDSPYAAEGTLAHSVAEAILRRPLKPDLPKALQDLPDPQEMLDYAQLYVDYIYRVIPLTHHHEIMIEQEVNFSKWVPEGWGTSDAIAIVGNTLHVFDLKYGKGVQVYADNNFQLRLYALGIVDALYDTAHIENVVMHICQPRLNHFDTEFIPLSELLEFGDWIHERALLALTKDAPRTPGEKQCTFCKAKAHCPELKAHLEAAMSLEFDNFDLPFINQLDDRQKSNVLQAAGMLTAFIAAIKDDFTTRLTEGQSIPGWKLVHGRQSRSWLDEESASDALQLLLSRDKVYEETLISPAKAEKALGKKHSKQLLEALCVTKPGAPALVPEADPRPGMNTPTEDLQNEFANFNE